MGFVMFPTVRRRMCQISLKGKSGDSLRDFEGKFWPGAFVIRNGLKNIIQIISAATSTEGLFTFFNFFTWPALRSSLSNLQERYVYLLSVDARGRRRTQDVRLQCRKTCAERYFQDSCGLTRWRPFIISCYQISITFS